jgi:hypothetical protein
MEINATLKNYILGEKQRKVCTDGSNKILERMMKKDAEQCEIYQF